MDEDEEVLFGGAINLGFKLNKTKEKWAWEGNTSNSFKDSLCLYHCFPGSF